MTMYRVYLEELATYEVDVEAANEEEAGEKAEELFVQAENIAAFPCEVHNREVGNVEKIE